MHAAHMGMVDTAGVCMAGGGIQVDTVLQPVAAGLGAKINKNVNKSKRIDNKCCYKKTKTFRDRERCVCV